MSDALVPVFVVLPERLDPRGFADHPPEGPYLMPAGVLPRPGERFAVTRGGLPWWTQAAADVREIAEVRWQLIYPMRANERGTIALLVTLSPQVVNRG